MLHLLSSESRLPLIAGTTLVSISLTMPAFAQQSPSWDYLSASLILDGEVSENGNLGDVDQGYRLEGAASLGDYAFFRSRIINHDLDIDGLAVEVPLDFQEFGFGGHYPIHANGVTLAPWGAISYDRVSLEGVLDGFTVNLGLRALFLDGDLETALEIKQGEVDNSAVDADLTALELSAAYYIASNIDAQLTYSNTSLDEDGFDEFDVEDVITLGARFRF